MAELLGAAVAELLGAGVGLIGAWTAPGGGKVLSKLLGAAVAELLGAAVELLLSMFIGDRFEKLFSRSESLRDFSERNQNSRFSMREKCQINFLNAESVFKCQNANCLIYTELVKSMPVG